LPRSCRPPRWAGFWWVHNFYHLYPIIEKKVFLL